MSEALNSRVMWIVCFRKRLAEDKASTLMRCFKKYRRRKAETATQSPAPATGNPTLIFSKPSRDIVDALYQHFAKWHPEVVNYASSLQEMRLKSEGERTQ